MKKRKKWVAVSPMDANIVSLLQSFGRGKVKREKYLDQVLRMFLRVRRPFSMAKVKRAISRLPRDNAVGKSTPVTQYGMCWVFEVYHRMGGRRFKDLFSQGR